MAVDEKTHDSSTAWLRRPINEYVESERQRLSEQIPEILLLPTE